MTEASRTTGTAAVGRLAPSPTGVLHLGNARTFLLAWLSVRSRGGSLLLRVEDIDGPRVKAGAVEQTVEDLRWLGLCWDGALSLQSQRAAAHRDAVDELLRRGLAYPCVCTRREIDEAASAPHESTPADGQVYPGTCRGRYATLADAAARTGRAPAVRFRVDTDEVPFRDGCCGPQAGAVRGDFVIQRRDGGAAYQLAVVVDDAAQGVTEVLRADDLLPSTPRQLLLQRALGLPAPRYVHVPLLVGADGRGLSKRFGDTSLRQLRERGVTARQVCGYLAKLCNLQPTAAACAPRDLLGSFDLDRLPKGALRADDHGLC